MWRWHNGPHQVKLLHSIQERTPRQTQKPGGARAVPTVDVERELNQGPLHGDKVDAIRRNGHAGWYAGRIRALDGNRCKLVGARAQSHDDFEEQAKYPIDGTRENRDLRVFLRGWTPVPSSTLPVFGQAHSGCLETDTASIRGRWLRLTVPKRLRAPLIALVIVAISIAHYATNPSRIWWHVGYQDLCYAPILVAAYWFGIPGGVVTAMIAGLGTSLHFHHEWAGNTAFIVSQYGQAVAFLISGAVGGALATAERRATRRHQQALAAIEAAHAELTLSHEQLLRADRLSSLGEIAAGLAHEIGNPLAGVKGALEIIASHLPESGGDREFSTLASREIARLEGLIEEFLRFAKPHEPRRSSVDILDVLDRVVPLISREAANRSVSIHVNRTRVSPVSIDLEQMVQVFVNIVLNAVQVSPPGSQVDIAPSITDGMLAVDVRDEGPGIRPEHLSKIFEPFFSTKKRGTGLGLSISQRIVQSHGGTIEVDQPGQGTIIRVLLPLVTDARPETGARTTP